MKPYPRHVIYLDQCGWIDLANGFGGLNAKFSDAANAVLKAAESDKVIFPISLGHFAETSKRVDSDTRKSLARFMSQVSRGYAMLPPPQVKVLEILDACGRLQGEEGMKLAPLILRRGLSHLAGLPTPKVASEVATPVQLEAMNRLAAAAMNDPNAFFQLVQHGLPPERVEHSKRLAEESAEIIEEVRKKNSVVPKDRRYEFERALYLSDVLFADLYSALKKEKGGLEELETVLRSKKRILELFKSMPTYNCFFELESFRSMQHQRRIHPNDMIDLTFLAVAIPYSDVVVTEKMWTEAAEQRRLDVSYDTKVTSDANYLLQFLKN